MLEGPGSNNEPTTQGTFPWNEGNRGRWDNHRGTLNLLTDASVLRAVGEIRSGRVIPCARPLERGIPSYYPEAAANAFERQMITAWKGHAEGDIQVASDQFTVQTHGMGITHIDALCHFGFQEKGFNATPFRDMASMDGVSLCGTGELGVIVTRGILADIPRSRGVDYLEPGAPVTASDLEPHLQLSQPGDALVVRTGRWKIPESRRTISDHPPLTGLHADCMTVVQDADIALLGTDAGGDNFPAVLDENSRPVHIFSLAYLGLPLLHNLDLEALAAACEERGTNSFFFAVAPLNMPGTTGSPVTPIAIL